MRVWRWFVIVWLCWVAPAQAELLIRVGIVTNASQVRVGSSSPAQIVNAAGDVLGQLPPMNALTAQATGGGIQLASVTAERLFIQPQEADSAVFIQDRWYRGLVELTPTSGGLMAINRVPLDDYVASVIGSEMGDRFDLEALRAQAVASRTYVLYQRNSRLDEPFDVGTSVDWQVYKGVEGETAKTQEASLSTLGQVLTHDGQLINAVFHSSSGGRTENVEHVWTQPLPYLRAVNDADWSPAMPWDVNLTSQELASLAPDIGSIVDVQINERSPQGRAMSVTLVGTQGNRTVPGSEFRRALDLRSTFFSVFADGGTITTASTVPMAGSLSFRVQGQGYGHGVGMSQWGAGAMADRGKSYAEILAFYYQGIQLAVVDPQ